MSGARQGCWGSAALQMRERGSDVFLEGSERTGWFDISVCTGEAAGLCVLEGSVSLFAWSHPLAA